MLKHLFQRKRLLGVVVSFLMVFELTFQSTSAQAATKIIKYDAGYDEAMYPQKDLNSIFTTENIIVDGSKDAAYDQCIPSAIENFRSVNADYSYASDDAKPHGEVRSLWDGPVLYLYVTVYDQSAYRSIAKAASGSAYIVTGPAITVTGSAISTSNNKAVSDICDSVTFGVDLYNDKVGYETDTIGDFTITAANDLIYYDNSSIPSLSSVMADPKHPNYQNRIKSYAAVDLYDENQNLIGYNVEVALQVEGLGLDNGTTLGLDIGINDVDYTTDPMSPSRVGQTFWSHSQDSLYTDFNHSNTNSIDWGNVTLTGWNGQDSFAYSSWRLSNAIRYLDTITFQKGVYTSTTQAELDAARVAAEAILANDTYDIATTNAAADRLEAAIAGLRWADTKYPDPADLPVQVTLPNIYQFFQSDRTVKTSKDWEARRDEILDLAQFYEYGYKPDPADSITIDELSTINTGEQYITYLDFSAWGMGIIPWSQTADCPIIMGKYTMMVGDKSAQLDIKIFLPTEEELEAIGRTGQKLPLILSFDGDNKDYRDAGYAIAVVSAGSSGDIRSNEYAWGTRAGAFYTLFPYSRNGEGALKEVSSEMAAAWTCSSMIDALTSLSTSPIEGAVAVSEKLDLDKLVVTGFSINGKYAFVSAVFDDRIDVCIPGAAGATGPSPWRYVYTGQEYDWTDTIFAPDDLSKALQVSFGTETLANSYRHNRVREISLFSHFLTPGHYYKMEDGAYGYGTRLPFDQSDLVATLAPRAIVLLNTTNDYNDGCVADCLGLEIAKSVYNTLGYSADDLVKFNLRKVFTTGDPHGCDSEQYVRTGEYLNSYFYGQAMTETTATYLNTDPFTLPVSNGKTESPFDYYYGGFNTITGGTTGVDGTDGWYYYSFPKIPTTTDTTGQDPVISTPTQAPTSTPTPTPSATPSVTPTDTPKVEEPQTKVEAVVEATENETVKEAVKAILATDKNRVAAAITVTTDDSKEFVKKQSVQMDLSGIAGMKAGKKAFVYLYDEKTSKFVELPNGVNKIQSDLSINMNVVQGGTYVVLNKKLKKNEFVSLEQQAVNAVLLVDKLTINTKKDSSKIIKINLPDTLIASKTLEEYNGTDATQAVKIAYKSMNKNIFKVNKSGKVTAVASGTANVRVRMTFCDGTIHDVMIKVTIK